MDAAEWTIAVLNALLGLGLGWPLTRLLARTSRGAKGALRLYPAVVASYLVECFAFSASMGTSIFSIAMAFVWGWVLGSRLRWTATAPAEVMRAVFYFALYSGLPAASFLSVPVLAALSGRHILSAEFGFQFGIPEFVPWPFNTILGFCGAVVLVTVVLKVVITTRIARRLMSRK